MKQIKIKGGQELTGTIRISGAKNSAVALVPASLLSDEEVTIDNIPNISDITALNEILEYLGATVSRDGELMKIDSRTIVNREVPENISSKLRASYYFMSALLGKFHHVEMYFPGGCKIGARPIDQTLKAFRQLGAEVVEENNKYIIDAKELKGAHIYLDMPSVGATINTMLVAVKAKGKTIIENAAKEPEIVNVATFLNNMGAKISGAGTSETSRQFWSQTKSKTERDLRELPFKAAYGFRPAGMKPYKGQKRLQGWGKYHWLFTWIPGFSNTIEEVAKAMISCVKCGYFRRIVDVRDIDTLSKW